MLEESIVLDKRYKHDISVVVDRLVMRHDVRKRLADSIETAVALADGLVEVEIVGSARRGERRGETDGAHATGAKGTRAAQAQIMPGEAPERGTLFTFSENFACPEHGPSLVELEPRIFSFNSPHGACDALHRASARRWRSTPSWSCPTRRCRSAKARSRRGPAAPPTTTSR